MPRLPHTSKGRARVVRARELMVKGYTRMQIQDVLVEEFDICRRSARNTMQHLDSMLIHESSNRRHVNQHRQLTKLSHTIQVALEGVQYFSEKGVVTDQRPKPNVAAAIEAIKEQNRILGLHVNDEAGAESWEESLPLILRPLPMDPRTSTPPPSNGHSNGHTNGTSPYSPHNGSS